jgi:hypothetical protein
VKETYVRRSDGQPGGSPIGWGNARCESCGARDRVETGRKHLSAGPAGVITCHQLACGHAWHRIVANVGSIFPGLLRNATFVPCDCTDEPDRIAHAAGAGDR